jgi:hypothetical protein
VTIPPPEESIFVANKNPFRDRQYINARRVYSPQLNDGDLFYNINVKCIREDTTFVRLYESFVNKSIRITELDVIVKISSALGGIRYQSFDDTLLKNGYISFTYNIHRKYYSVVFILEGGHNRLMCIRGSDIKSCVMGHSSLLQVNKEYDGEIYDVLVNISEKMKDTYLYYFSDLSRIPDECFEIRQVKRLTTDF